MTRGRLGRAVHSSLAIFVALSSLVSARALADAIPFEIGIAAREAGHVRGLLERLNKQNVLYQFHLGGVTKQMMQETTSQIDRVIETLETGSPAYSVAAPVTEKVRAQLHVLDGEWGKLRRLALASPYDYLRFGSDMMPNRSRMGDPFSLQIFDEMTVAAIREADELQQMIVTECDKTGYEFCDATRQAGYFNMRVERIAKQLVLIYAGIEVKANLVALRATREQVDTALSVLGSSPILTGAMAPSRGRSATFVTGLWQSIQSGWGKMGFEVDLALEGHVAGLDIQRTLKVQRDLVDDLDRIRVALSRFAQAKSEG